MPRAKTLAFALGWAYGLLATPAVALDLLQSYQLALQNDGRYQTSRAETAAAREALPQALSQLLPNVSASLNRNKNDTAKEDTVMRLDPATGKPVETVVHDRFEYFGSNYALTLRQPLYRKQNFAQYAQAESRVESAEALLDRSLQDLVVRLCSVYFDALMAQKQLEVVLAQKEANAIQLKAAQRSFELGQGTRTDIDDAQARYDMALSQELEHQNIRFTKGQLEIIINQPANNLASLQAERLPLVDPAPNDAEAWINTGVEANPELRSLRADIEVARQEIEKARAGHHPTVDLVAQRTKSYSDGADQVGTQYLTSMVGLQVSVPIFAGGYVNSTVRQSVANLERAQQSYETRRREVANEIRKEFQKITEGVLKVRAKEQAERSTRQSVFSNEKGFQAGTRSRVDILNAEQLYTKAQMELATSRYEYMLARVKLQTLVSGIDESEIGLINSWLGYQ